MLRTLRLGLRALFRRRTVEQDLDDELRHYLDLAARENVRAGMPPDIAERAARVRLGSVASAKEEARGSGWETWVASAFRDLQYAARTLRHHPGFALTAVLTLALGIGVATTMFSVVNAVVLRPLPYRDATRLALLWTDDARRGLHREGTTYRTIAEWQAASRVLDGVASFSTRRVTPVSADRGRGRTRLGFVSANLFPILGVAPEQGRRLTRADEDRREPVAVISYAFWQRWFDGAPDVVGRSVEVDRLARDGRATLTVVGVMPRGFWFPDRETDIWTPVTTWWRFDRESAEPFADWARRWTGVARLRSGASMADARADLARVGRQLAADHPDAPPDFPGFAASVVPVLDAVVGRSLQTALWVLLGAVTLVLLIACVNVANLLLARGAARHQEFVVRRALGGTRGRLVRQLAAESLLLALAGGAAGVLLATWGTRLLGVAAAAFVPRIDAIATDARVLVFALSVSVATGLVFGLVPALRLAGADAGEAVRAGSRDTGRVAARRARELLVAVECALAITLLAGAGLLLRSLQRVDAVDPGFDPRNVLTMRLEFGPGPPTAGAEDGSPGSANEAARVAARDVATQDLLERLRVTPGVRAAALTDDLFRSGSGNSAITIPGRVDQGATGEVSAGTVSPGFFTTMGVPIVRGRDLSREDGARAIRARWPDAAAGEPPAERARRAVAGPAVVNEAFVRRFFPGDDPVGRRFCLDPAGGTDCYEIVGVAGDMLRQGLERAAVPEYYGPYLSTANARADLLVRTTGRPLALAAAIREAVRQALPAASVRAVSTADTDLGGFSAQRRLQTWLLASFALLAVILAAVGMFGLVHYAVAVRTGEIGIRVALGATRGKIIGMVLAEGLKAPLAGIAVGLAASAGLTRVLKHLLFGIGATDPVTFAGVGLMLILVATAACYVAGLGAMRVDPAIALRGADAALAGQASRRGGQRTAR